MTEGRAYKYTKDFVCTGDKCSDTCCKGWSMQVDDAHINLYNSKLSELSFFVTEEAGCKVMKRDSKTDKCLKLEEGLCGIHKQFGADALGDACYFYPRITRKVEGSVLQSATLSCPETARLVLYGDSPFSLENIQVNRLPESIKEVLTKGVTAEDFFLVQQKILTAIEESENVTKALEKLIGCIYSFQLFASERWAGGISLFLNSAESKLPEIKRNEEDFYHILITTYGLLHATHKKPNPRFREVLEKIQSKLGIMIDSNTLEVATMNNETPYFQPMINIWQQNSASGLDKVMKRWLQAQVVMHAYPYAGFGSDIRGKTMNLIVRFAITRLGLMAYTDNEGNPPSEEDVIKVVQSVSRFMDHLGSPELSEKLYANMNWNEESYMRGLVVI
jgi:lysine-N-methylase